MRKNQAKSSNSIFPIKVDKLKKQMESRFENNPDLVFTIYEHQKKKIAVFYIAYLVEPEMVHNYLLKPLLTSDKTWSNPDILNDIPLSTGKTNDKLPDILQTLLIGEIFIYVEGEPAAVSFLLAKKEKRNLAQAETESLVQGPKVAFTESLATNLNIVRWNIHSTDLVLEKIMIGERAPREVRLIYLKSIAKDRKSVV